MKRLISLPLPHGRLYGELHLPDGAPALLLHARLQPEPGDERLAALAAAHGLAFLAMDLLSAEELHFADAADNVPRLAQRLIEVFDLIHRNDDIAVLPAAGFCAGRVTPALIRAAAQRDRQLRALACHGGLIDHAGRQALDFLAAPLLMLFDADDATGPAAFSRARHLLHVPHDSMALLPGEFPEERVVNWLRPQLGV